MQAVYFFLSFGLTFLSFTSAYKWPNPLIDKVDHELFDQAGYNAGRLISAGIPSCSFIAASDKTGRQITAEWIRTAFHDMATHDAATGTGGLDASIAVESGRDENKGPAINATLVFLTGVVTPTLSLSDLIAMAAVASIDVCGGPLIPFRAGRIDNFTPSTPGVPEPQQDLQSHLNAFTKMGFTQEEMIGLVACGHTVGGVHHTAFPDIVKAPADPVANAEGVQRFDSTFDSFDNKVATEFVAGTPTNPLAYGFKETTRSDFRIFASDGNQTISRFAASNEGFKATCGTLFEKMINTVPKTVTLSEVIKPIPVKPKVFFNLLPNGYIQLVGEVRFFGMQENPQRTVSFKWHNRRGGCADRTTRCATPATHSAEQVTTLFRGTQSLWYSFNATLDDSAGISDFWFEVDEHDGRGPKQVYSEKGTPFPVNDRFFLVANQSCFSVSPTTFDATINSTYAVRKRENPDHVKSRVTRIAIEGQRLKYALETEDLEASLLPNSPSSNYQLYRTSGTSPGVFSGAFWYVDGIATKNGRDTVDPEWGFPDFVSKFLTCGS